MIFANPQEDGLRLTGAAGIPYEGAPENFAITPDEQARSAPVKQRGG